MAAICAGVRMLSLGFVFWGALSPKDRALVLVVVLLMALAASRMWKMQRWSPPAWAMAFAILARVSCANRGLDAHRTSSAPWMRPTVRSSVSRVKSI